MTNEEMELALGLTLEDKANWLDCNGKYYDDPEVGWRQKLEMHLFPKRSASVYVMPGYESPASGKWIETPRQRREDMKATGTREWAGIADERAQMERNKKYEAERQEKALDHAVRTAWQNLPDSKKQQALAEAG